MNTAQPAASLDTRDAVGIIVGIVIGSGIFTVPSLVAKGTTSPGLVLGLWLVGGVLSVIGGLCYAELATSCPSTGGDYAFLQRAYGRNLAFLYGWARMAVITTGSIAFLAFTFGDYMTKVAPLGAYSPTLYAVLCVVLLTLLNLAGIHQGKTAQNLFTSLEVLGVVAIIVVGLLVVAPAAPAPAPAALPGPTPSAGLAMVFVLYAYGGWNEAAYVSAELKNLRSMAAAITVSLAVVTALYVLANLAYIRGLSLSGMAESNALAADLLERAFGSSGRVVVSSMIALAALTSGNATMIVGARSNFALGRDFPVFGWLGRWDQDKSTPSTGLIAQCLVSLALVALGTATRQGLQTMIDYTAPVFWFFFLLVGIGIFVMRVREPSLPRPFVVPLYPITPLVFCATCAYLLYSSLAYAKTGAIVGVGVVVLGLAPLLWSHRRWRPAPRPQAARRITRKV
jgi:amino acid transporter